MQLQYIGARYVPVFYQNSVDETSNWEVNVEYEPLTFVTTQNNHLYLSKKTVPDNIGTPAQNTQYWLDMGVFTDAGIAELEARVATLEGDYDTLINTTIPGIVDDITNIGGSLRDINNDIVSIRGSVISANGRIDQLENMTLLSHKKVIFIGDSYATTVSGVTNGIYTPFCNNAGLTDGVNAKLYSLGAAGFVANGQGKTFGDLADDAIADAFFDANEVTDIFIAGGCNDHNYAVSDVNTAKVACLNKLKAAFPNAKIWIAMVGGFVSPTSRATTYTVSKYVYDYTVGGNVVSITNAHLPMMNMSNFASDGIHPSAAGVNSIGILLGRALVTNSSQPEWATYQRYSLVPGNQAGQLTSIAEFNVYPMKNGYKLTSRKVGFATLGNQTFAYNTGALVCIGNAVIGSNALVPNCIDTASEPIMRYPATVYCLNTATGTDWYVTPGEIIGIQDPNNADRVVYYFRTGTAPKGFTTKTFRFAEFEVDIPM